MAPSILNHSPHHHSESPASKSYSFHSVSNWLWWSVVTKRERRYQSSCSLSSTHTNQQPLPPQTDCRYTQQSPLSIPIHSIPLTFPISSTSPSPHPRPQHSPPSHFIPQSLLEWPNRKQLRATWSGSSPLSSRARMESISTKRPSRSPTVSPEPR